MKGNEKKKNGGDEKVEVVDPLAKPHEEGRGFIALLDLGDGTRPVKLMTRA